MKQSSYLLLALTMANSWACAETFPMEVAAKTVYIVYPPGINWEKRSTSQEIACANFNSTFLPPDRCRQPNLPDYMALSLMTSAECPPGTGYYKNTHTCVYSQCPDISWTPSADGKSCTRPDGIRLPTSGEKQMVQSIFKNGIDFDKVRVSCGKYPFGIESLPVPSDDVAVAPDNTIHFSKKHCLADFSKGTEGHQAWFIHEMAHVWQYQLNYPTMEYGIKWAIRGTISNVYGYSLNKGDFSEYNMEQQGDILRDYYLVKYKQQVTPQGTAQDYERILSNFLKDPKNARNLPHVTP